MVDAIVREMMMILGKFQTGLASSGQLVHPLTQWYHFIRSYQTQPNIIPFPSFFHPEKRPLDPR